jgi:hypothetical protein
MSGYSQPGLRNLGSQGPNSNMFKDPMVIGGIMILAFVVFGIIAAWYFGLFSSERKKDNRLYYNNLGINNVSDINPLNRIRANEFSSIDSQNEPITGSGGLWVGGGRRRRRPAYSTTVAIPENPITESGIIIPPLPNPTPETSTQPMIPEIPPLSSARYNFGNTQNLSDSAMQSRIGTGPLNNPTYGGGLERRTSKKTKRTPY